MRSFFSISVLLLFLCCLPGLGEDVHVTAFPTAVFSPDGSAVYYVQFDLHADVRDRKVSPELTVGATMRVIDEVVSIHKFDLANGNSELVTMLPQPPWVGLAWKVAYGFWFNHQEAKMWWSPVGELQYEVHGPPAILVNKQVVWYSKTPTFVSSNKAWADLSYASYNRDHVFIINPFYDRHKTELKYVVAGSKEVITSYRDGQEAQYYLVVLDHDRRTAKLLATGSDEDRRHPAHFYTYDWMLGRSRLKGPLKEHL